MRHCGDPDPLCCWAHCGPYRGAVFTLTERWSVKPPCEEKSTFPGRRSARRYAIRFSNRYGVRHYAYHCQHCGKWHLTTSPDFMLQSTHRPRSRTRRRGRRLKPGECLIAVARQMRQQTDADSSQPATCCPQCDRSECCTLTSTHPHTPGIGHLNHQRCTEE